MSKPSTGYSNDPIYSELNNSYADNVNFFSGKTITIEDKPEESKEGKPEEDLTEDQITGLESVVSHFGRINFDREEIIDGTEGIGSFTKNLLVSLWELIKDIGRWIADLFTNKIARIDSRVSFTEQKRKMNGVKEGEVKYPYTIKRLMIPSQISTEPDWVCSCAEVGIGFYRNVTKAHQMLKEAISKDSISNLDQHKKDVTERCIARPITGSGFGSTNMAKTDILPGNRIFVVRAPLPETPEAVVSYFIESDVEPVLKSKVFIPTPYLIDSALAILKKYRTAVVSTQKNSSELQRKFEREVSDMLKGEKTDQEVRLYLKWLVNTNKRLMSTTLQHAVQTIEALDDFIDAGLK